MRRPAHRGSAAPAARQQGGQQQRRTGQQAAPHRLLPARGAVGAADELRRRFGTRGEGFGCGNCFGSGSGSGFGSGSGSGFGFGFGFGFGRCRVGRRWRVARLECGRGRPGRGRGGRCRRFGRGAGIEFEQALRRVEDFGAAPAAHPAVGDLQLVLHHAEHRAAGGAARGQAHGCTPRPSAGTAKRQSARSDGRAGLTGIPSGCALR